MPPSSTVPVSRYLLHEAPQPVRESYRVVAAAVAPSARHRHLCSLGERALAHLASLAVSAYRAADAEPDPKVESAFGRMRRLSLGHYVELLRIIPPHRSPLLRTLQDTATDLPESRRFAAAVSGIEDAVEMEAHNIGRAVTRRLEGSHKKVDSSGFWDLFVAYRNRSEGHSASHGWPVDHPDYYDLMAPLLEGALVEVLTQAPARTLFDGYPLATLDGVEYEGGQYQHRFAGEHTGLPLRARIVRASSVTEGVADEAGGSGSRYVLSETDEGEYDIVGPYVDLLADGAPAPLEPPAPEEEACAPEESGAPSRPRQPIVGRDVELRRIEYVLDQNSVGGRRRTSERGHGHIVFLAGVSGVGKSSMAQEVGRMARDRGYDVVDVACEPFHQGMSLFPMRELVRQLAGGASFSDLVESYYGPESLQASLADLADDPTGDPAQRRDALVATFANAIYGRFASAEGSASARPILIQIDDLERIDIGTADALLCVIARFREGSVVIVGAYRTDLLQEAEEGGQRHPLRTILTATQRRPEHALHLDLGSLDRTAIRPVTEAILRGPCRLPARFYSRLYDETEGNPLFIREILHSLSTPTGGRPAPLREQDGVWHMTADVERWEIPSTVEQAISARLRNLDKGQLGELEKASVIGRRFAFSVICELSKASEDEMLDYLESFLSFDIIQEIEEGDDTFEFSHGKIRDVLYQNMSRLRRRRVHSSVADILSDMRTGTDQDWGALIGEHLYQAHRYGEACPVLLEAARESMETHAVTEAAEQFRKAVESGDAAGYPEGEDRLDVRMEQALALKLSSDYDPALTLFKELAAEASSPSRQGWAFNHIADIDQMNGNAEAALRSYERCETIAREHGDLGLLIEVVADLHELHDRQAERLTGLDEAAVEAHREASRQHLDEEVRLAMAHGDDAAQSRAYRNVAKRHRRAGELDEAIANYRRGVALQDARVATHKVLIPYAKTLRFVGEHAEAMGVVDRVLDWSLQTGARRSEGIARQYRGLLLMERAGDDEAQQWEAREEIATALAIHAEVGFNRGERDTAMLLGEWHARRGDWASALEHFDHAVEAPFEDPRELVSVVVAQLHAMNEDARADRLETDAALADVSS